MRSRVRFKTTATLRAHAVLQIYHEITSECRGMKTAEFSMRILQCG
jgi:hypothetical protein